MKALKIPHPQRTPALSNALLSEFEAAEAEHAERRAKGQFDTEGESECLGALVEAVCRSRNPRIIPRFVRIMSSGTAGGSMIDQSLAEFGDGALEPVMGMLKRSGRHDRIEVADALRVFGLMLSTPNVNLSAASRGRLVLLAKESLGWRDASVFVLDQAIALAGGSGSPEVEGALERLASEPQEALARGIDAGAAEKIIRPHAALALKRVRRALGR